MKKLSLFLMISIFMVFSGCKKDDALTDSGNNSGGGSTTTYAVGDYYNKDGIKGIVYRISDGGKHGMIVSLDESRVQWSTETIQTRATDMYNGEYNTSLIISSFDLDAYPAFKWCKHKNSDGITGWYIPSKSELADIIRVKDILNEGLINNGGVIIHVENLYMTGYWTSTETDEFSAKIDYNINEQNAYKLTSNPVRAIHSF